MSALKKNHSGSRVFGGLMLLLVLSSSVGANEEKSKVERSVDETRESLQDLDLMSKGISRVQSSGSAIDLNLSEGLQSGEQVRFPISRSNLGENDSNRSQRKMEWAQRNWLLAGWQSQLESESAETGAGDGVEAEKDSAGQIRSGTNDETEFWLEASVNMPGGRESEMDRDPSSTDQEIERQSAVNPLDDFLAQWIAPSELDRLNLAKRAESGATQFEPDSSNIPGLPERIERGGRSMRSLSKAETPAPNPYLDGWAQSSGSTALPHLGSLGRETVVRPAAGASIGVGASLIPSPELRSPPATDASNENYERWKPPARTDEEYFPRLKRF